MYNGEVEVEVMVAVKGVYDGRVVRPAPGEAIPYVEEEVPVVILFLEALLARAEAADRQNVKRWNACSQLAMPLLLYHSA